MVIPIKHRQLNVNLEYEQYKQQLLQQGMKHRRNDYDHYIKTPNDPEIQSSLVWWRKHASNYTDLANMARDVLAVLASRCTVE